MQGLHGVANILLSTTYFVYFIIVPKYYHISSLSDLAQARPLRVCGQEGVDVRRPVRPQPPAGRDHLPGQVHELQGEGASQRSIKVSKENYRPQITLLNVRFVC